MLLNSVILVLREALEAAVLVSVLLALSLNMRLRPGWFWWSAALAMVATPWFAASLDEMTDALNGAGQEVCNAALQLLVYCLAVAVVLLSAAGPAAARQPRKVLPWLMALAVACTLIREGSEILVYVTGFVREENLRTAVFAGSAIGAGIGISLGILFFAAFRAMRPDRAQLVCLAVLSMIGSGMVMQATILLEQVDWLPAGEPLWDSSRLLDEQSIAGELVYAVFGYESTPSPLQAAFYGSSLFIAVGAWLASARHAGNPYAS